MNLLSLVEKRLEPIRRRIRLMINKGVVRSVNSAPKMQELAIDIRAGEHKAGVEYYEPYGFTSHPHSGAEHITGFIGGDRSLGVVITVADRRYRLQGLETGDVALFSSGGNKAILKADGDIEVFSPKNIKMNGENIHIDAVKILRLEGEGVEIHGRKYVQTDVHGKGSRETWNGGADYQTDSYTTGATGSATEHGLDQPDIPSDI